MLASESKRPRFCFKPRSIASCKERGRIPGINFVGVLPEKGLTPRVPGMGCPGVLAGSVVVVAGFPLGECLAAFLERVAKARWVDLGS